MIESWRTEQILLTVKAYPSISKKYQEASCMAGITANREWIRLYPVPFRDLADEQKFKKYTWIEAKVKKSPDFRVESHFIDPNSIRIDSQVPSDNSWSARNALVLPKVMPASHVFRENRNRSEETLALIRPEQIIDLEIEETPDKEFRKQVANLNTLQQQQPLFNTPPLKPLELIPYSFRYRFIDDNKKEHKLKIVDWEIYQLYRKVQHRENWHDLIRQKYIDELGKRELHLFLGTIYLYPKNWIIIGVYYPTSTNLQFNMFNG